MPIYEMTSISSNPDALKYMVVASALVIPKFWWYCSYLFVVRIKIFQVTITMHNYVPEFIKSEELQNLDEEGSLCGDFVAYLKKNS